MYGAESVGLDCRVSGLVLNSFSTRNSAVPDVLKCIWGQDGERGSSPEGTDDLC